MLFSWRPAFALRFAQHCYSIPAKTGLISWVVSDHLWWVLHGTWQELWKKTFVLRQHSWFISFRCRIRCVDMTASLDLSLFTTVDDRFEIFVHFTCVDPVDHICYMKSINIRWFVWISFKFGFANRSILCTIWTNFVMLCIAYVNTGSSLSWFFLMCNFVNS